MFKPIKKLFHNFQDNKVRLKERALLEILYLNDTVSLKRIFKNEAACVLKMVRGTPQSQALPLYVFMAGGLANGQISRSTKNVLNDALLCHLSDIAQSNEDALRIFNEHITRGLDGETKNIEIVLKPWKKYFTESKTQVGLDDVRACSEDIYIQLPHAIQAERLKRTIMAAGFCS